MRIINYNPTKIEKEFEELKAKAEKYNKRAAISFKMRAAWVTSFVIMLLIASVASIVAITMHSEPHILLIMLAIILSVGMIGFLLYLISWLIDGQDKMSVTHEMSFAMKFWNLYHQGIVLEIEKHEDIVVCDISLPMDVMFDLNDRKNLIWIDHHVSMIEEYEAMGG